MSWSLFFIASVRDGVLDVEYPLIESHLSKIDEHMERALTELNWTSSGKVQGCSCYFIYACLSVCLYLSVSDLISRM